MIWPFTRIRRLEVELADARAKLAAGGNAVAQRRRAHVEQVRQQIERELGRA